MKNLRQIKDLIKNIANEKNINSQILLKNYMIHRLLKRIYLSEYSKFFIIKGGILITGIIGVQARTTVDLDTTINSFPINNDSLKSMFNDIFSLSVDNIEFKLKYIEQTRIEDEYKGYKISIEANLEEACIPIKVDITTGDKITPHEIVFPFELLLENDVIEINAYNIETIISEKLETIISRSTVNTRMKDFYDIHMLLRKQSNNIDYSILTQAFKKTTKHRGSYNLIVDGSSIITMVFNDDKMQFHWKRYKKKYHYANNISWREIEKSVFYLWNNLDI